MDTFAPFAGIGPTEALIGAARRLRVPFEPAAILAHACASPSIMKALCLAAGMWHALPGKARIRE